jgi:hypothetical protein
VQAVTSNLAQFNAAFARYVETWTARGNGTLDDALEKKGRDIGIQLWKAFAAHKWGGSARAPKDLARSELDARAAEGKGIKLRASLMAEYLSARGELRAALRGKKTRGAINAKIRLWQKFVGRELAIRQRGIGYLSVAFLWFRKRSSQARGTYFVQNRKGAPIGEVERGEGFFRITADPAGVGKVSNRYGIVSGVLANATADIEQYLLTRERSQFAAAFASFGK